MNSTPQKSKGRRRKHPTHRIPGGSFLQLADGTYAKARYNRRKRQYRLTHISPHGTRVQSDYFFSLETLELSTRIVPEPTLEQIARAGWGSMAA